MRLYPSTASSAPRADGMKLLKRKTRGVSS
jgi:hypothetical protein